MKSTAIVLSAGSGRRMGSDIPKQYLPLLGRPVLFYTLQAFEQSDIDEVILVAAEDYLTYCREEFVEKYKFKKIRMIIAGGAERYDSVYAALCAVSFGVNDIVLVHDGARSLITSDIINKCIEASVKNKACVIAMPVKDTIKVSDPEGFVASTPERSTLWMVQTPQGFSANMLKDAYASYFAKGGSGATDDAMMIESQTDRKVALIEGSYENLKITTAEDLLLAESILKNRGWTEPV